MQTIRISATAARNKFFKLLDQVELGAHVVIEKDKKEIAIMSPKLTSTNWQELRKALKESRGILKNYDPEDNPLRRKGASDFLGRWDKNLKLINKNETGS